MANRQAVTVMTYNVLTSRRDGSMEGGRKIKKWKKKRKAGVVKFIKQANPDAVSIQEGGGWATKLHGYGGRRQADSIESALGSTYSLVSSEIPPSQHHYRRYGNYIIFRNSTYRAVGAGGHWSLGNKTTAAYQMLANRTTGATFLFVAPHTVVGVGASKDQARETETQTLIKLARAKAGGQAIIYAGDFNSYKGPKHPHDGPGIAMRAAHISDGFLVAPHKTHAKFDSANQYLRKPPKFSLSIDHIYAEPGVVFLTWSELLNVSHGRLVGVIPSDHNPVVSAVTIPY